MQAVPSGIEFKVLPGLNVAIQHLARPAFHVEARVRHRVSLGAELCALSIAWNERPGW